MTHTPEPWVPSGQLIIGPPRAYPNPKATPMPLVIGEVHWDYDGDRGARESRIKWKEAEANQILMCASPDLLKAAEAVLACGVPAQARHLCEAMKVLEAAVKKAKGEITET